MKLARILGFWSCALLASGKIEGQEPGSLPPTALWKPGISWSVSVERFTPLEASEKEQIDPPAHRYTLRVLVIGQERIDGRDCWKLVYVPVDGSGNASGSRSYVSIDKEKGWT